MNINEAVAFFRCASGMTQKDLAEKVGVDRSYIVKIEKGTKIPSAQVAKLICEALKITPNELYGVKEEAGNDTANC